MVNSIRLVHIGLVCVFCALPGCLPRTTVVSSPGPHDKGVRFYRPKPYLLVQPVESDPAGSEVAIELQYLPDFSEEYSIHVRPGFGVNNTKITLDQGWNLVAIDQELDSRVAEQIAAVGKLLDGAGNVIPTAKRVPDENKPRMVVNATNVPIGFYESVIGCGPDGRKQLMGWHYVGFAPYQSCPLASNGGNCLPCEAAFLYGLVYRNGVMVFEPLNEIGKRDPATIHATETPSASSPPSVSRLRQPMAETLSRLLGVVIPPESVSVNLRGGSSVIEVLVSLDSATGQPFAARYAQRQEEVMTELDRLARQELLDANARVELSWQVSAHR